MWTTLVSEPVIWLDWPEQWTHTQLPLPEVPLPSLCQAKDVGEVSSWAAATHEDGQGFCRWKSLSHINAVKGMMPYWAIMATATPLGSLRWSVILAISFVHPRDTMMTKMTTMRITFRALSMAFQLTANDGATVAKEVPCVRSGLQSSGLSEVPLVLFILLRVLETPSSVNSWEGEEGDSEVQITSN